MHMFKHMFLKMAALKHAESREADKADEAYCGPGCPDHHHLPSRLSCTQGV